MTRAPRPLLRLWKRPARGACAALCLWLATLAPGPAHADIVAAEYSDTTGRYPHGVLGDTIEHAALMVRMAAGDSLSARLPQDLVFEDSAPRLADLDGDGAPEVITVESHQQKGARLSIWTVQAGELTRIAATPFIGTRFRWLAPVGAADLDGDGRIEIAYVDRPHQTKALRVWRYENGRLSRVADRPGFSNHKIGWPFIVGGIRDCGQGSEMILATGNWTHVVSARLEGRSIKTRTLGRYTGPESVDAALICP